MAVTPFIKLIWGSKAQYLSLVHCYRSGQKKIRIEYLMHCKLEDCSWVHSFPIPRPFSSIVMSTEVRHLDLPQTLDIESGHHEPWSLQTVSEKSSLPNTPSSQTLVSNSKPGSVYPSGEKYEIKLESESPPKPVSVPKPAKKKVSRWILWNLWFNTYRYENPLVIWTVDFLTRFHRKFFVFTLCFNMIGLSLAASGHFPYAANYAGSIAVANFNFSILMRNEVFGRLLYLFFNTLFAKVCCPPVCPIDGHWPKKMLLINSGRLSGSVWESRLRFNI